MSGKTLDLGKSEEVTYRRGINLVTMMSVALVLFGTLPMIAFYSGVRPSEYLWLGMITSGIGVVLFIANYVMGWNKYPVTEDEED